MMFKFGHLFRKEWLCVLLLSVAFVLTGAESSADGASNLDLCPFSSQIYPCSCTWDDDLWEPDLYCHNIESLEQLQTIFQTAIFPEKRFWRIRLSGAPLGDLPADLFNDVQFDEVHLNNCNITSVHPEAFRASKPHMDTLELYSNQLTDESFPWSSLGEYPNLWFVHLDHNLFTSFPALTSAAIEDINLWSNHITTFGQQAFRGAPNLRIINVSPFIEGFDEDSFMTLENLEELHLSHNCLGDLVEGQVVLNSEHFQYLYLSNNSVADIHPRAITGVTSSRFKLFLEDNLLTRVKEEVFLPLMSRMLDGWGELELEGNPLICDCDMYWLLSNDTLLSNVRSGACDGVELVDMDISGWEC